MTYVYKEVSGEPGMYSLEPNVPPVVVNKYSRLLGHDAIHVEGATVSVGDVLSYYANQLGGVHWGPEP